MSEELRKLKCELCESERYILIKIEVASDTFGSGKGICCQCFKDGNIEEKIFLKNKNFILQQLENASERKRFWSKELKSLTPKK